MGASMSWHLIHDKEKITKIINYLINERIEINVRIEGEETKFSSRFIETLPGSKRGNAPVSSDKTPALVMDTLVPDRGNSLIQQSPQVGVEILTDKYLCRCHIEYICENDTSYPYYGLMISFPEFFELEERRREERVTLDSPEVISAVFYLDTDPEEFRSYELNILDYSDHGVALLVKKKDSDLLQMLDPGDRIPEITIFSEPGLIHMDGTVRHKTKIEAGKHRGNYILGLESNTIIGDIIREGSKPHRD
jgi:hypothetical protein